MVKKVLSWILTLVVLVSAVGVANVSSVAAAEAPTAGNTYYIKNKNSGLYLQVANNSASNGANVCQSKGTGKAGQKWRVVANSDGSFRLQPAVNTDGAYCLDVPNGSSADLANIQIWSANGYTPQNFKFKAQSDGSYGILTAASNYSKALDVLNFSKDDGANVIQYTYAGGGNQQWYFEKTSWPGSSSSGSSSGSSSSSSSSTVASSIDGNGYPDQLMQFVSTSDGKFVVGSGTSQISSSSTKGTNTKWKLVKSGSDYYRLINASTGNAMAPSGNSATNGAKVMASNNPSGSSQYWKIVAVKNDAVSKGLNYKIVNYANTNLALTLSGSSYVLNTYSGSSAQCFRFNSYGAEGFAGYCKTMSGSEKASVTGGVLGDVVYVTSLSQLQNYASGSTAYTIVINSNISASSLTKVTVGQNKTFVGSFGKGTLNNIHFRCTSNSGNVIFKNITFKHDANKNANDDIQMYISNGNNFWVDHCTFSGHSSTTSSDVDKHMYVGLKADYVTVNGCQFLGHKYGLILGYPSEDGTSTYGGYPRMTIANNYFYNVLTRAPGLMRYGYFHCYNNFVYGFNLGYTPYTGCKIYSEKNYFDKGNYKGAVVDDKGVGGFTDSGSVVSSSVSNLSTGGTSWRPSSNYGYSTRSAADAKSWVQSYTGAQKSKISYAID